MMKSQRSNVEKNKLIEDVKRICISEIIRKNEIIRNNTMYLKQYCLKSKKIQRT